MKTIHELDLQRFTRTAFIVVSIPFTAMAFLEISWSKGYGPSSAIFLLCGLIFIFGSIFSLNGELPFNTLVLLGSILNIFGAALWLHLFSMGILFLGTIGVGFAIGWILSIWERYLAERH